MSRFLRAALCCVPYAFFCLWGDVTYDTLLQYLIIVPAVLWLIRTPGATLPRILLGHTLSFAASLVCLHLFRTERWRWYFKPFSAFQTLAALSLAALIIHLFLCRRRRD